MIKNKFREFGNLKKGEHYYHTNNKVLVEYPNRFTSLFKFKYYLKENCILIETKVFSHYNKKYSTNVLAEMNKCNYLNGNCQIKPNEIMIWEVNKKQNCKFISIRIFNGYFNNNFWINNDNQIALNLLDKYSYDCDNELQLISEGYALRSIADHSDPALKSVPNRGKREVETFQEAGELQYLENNFENHLNHTVKTFCRMFNEHNEILEILLKENPKRFIQKARSEERRVGKECA